MGDQGLNGDLRGSKKGRGGERGAQGLGTERGEEGKELGRDVGGTSRGRLKITSSSATDAIRHRARWSASVALSGNLVEFAGRA